jgi:hypothetical protein
MCPVPLREMLALVLMHQHGIWRTGKDGDVRRALTDAVGLEPPPLHGSLLAASRPTGARSDLARQYRRHYLLMGLSDTLAVGAALLLAYQLRFGRLLPPLDFWLLLATVPLTTSAVYLTMRLYRAHQFSTAEEFRRIIVAVSLIVSATVTVSFWSKAPVSRLWMLLSWALGLVLALSARRLWHRRVRRTRLAGRLTFRTLVVGANLEAEHLAATMATRELGFLPVGFVTGGRDELRLDDPRVVGPVGRLRELIRETGADCLFVVASAVTPTDVAQVMKARRQENVEVRFTANLPAVLSSRLAPQAVGGVMALSVNVPQLTRVQAATKRACDVLGSALGLLVLLPLFAVVALAVKATSRGPVLFRQERVGLRGRPFTQQGPHLVAGQRQVLTLRVGAGPGGGHGPTAPAPEGVVEQQRDDAQVLGGAGRRPAPGRRRCRSSRQRRRGRGRR